MPIISRVEAKSRRGKLTFSAIIIVLLLSGTTMIYPFLIMASGTLGSEMDETNMDLIPDYMIDDRVLLQKVLETKHNQMVELRNRAHGRVNYSCSMAALPETLVVQQAEDLLSFLDQTKPPQYWRVLGASRGIRTTPEVVRELGKRLRRRYNNDLARFNREIGAAMPGWYFCAFQPPDWISKRTDYQPNPIHKEFLLMSKSSPWPQRRLVSISGYFVEMMLIPVYGSSDTKAYNQAHVQGIDSDDNYVLPRTVPGVDQPKLREEWLEYVLKELNTSFISLNGVPEADYQAFLKGKYGYIKALT